MYFKAQGARIDKITWGDKQIAKDGFTLGRVANRIAQGKFTLNDQQYSVAVNNNGNSLHGGSRQWNGPFANANWTKVDQTPPNAAFSLRRSLPGGAARGLVLRERSSSFSRERASSWDASVSGREQPPVHTKSLSPKHEATYKQDRPHLILGVFSCPSVLVLDPKRTIVVEDFTHRKGEL